MRIRFVAKDPDSVPDQSPTLYKTDRGSWLVQGWAVTDAAAPLAVEAREQQSTVHIHIHGGPDLPDIRLELDGRRIRDADEDEQCDWRLAAYSRVLARGQG